MTKNSNNLKFLLKLKAQNKIMRGISWYVVFIVAVIGMVLAGIIIIFYHLLPRIPKEANKLACHIKYLNYCFRWIKDQKEPGDWDKTNPLNCEKVEIRKPSEQDCKKLLLS